DRVLLALVAGTRVGDPGIHRDRADRATLEVTPGHDAGRGDDLVGREDARSRAGAVGHDEGDVQAFAFPGLHSGHRRADAESDGFRGHGHSGSALRPLVIGTRCGVNVSFGAAPSSAAASWTISGVCRCFGRPYGRTLSSIVPKRYASSMLWPAPETPVFPSTMISSPTSRPFSAGARARSAAVG